MKQKHALHTAARRYLLERIAALRSGIPQDRLRLAPEAQVRLTRIGELQDFLDRIERATPHPPGSASVVRDWLLAVVREAPWSGKFERRNAIGEVYAPSPSRLAVRDEEAALFGQYVAALTDEQLRDALPLPYRRTLGREEADQLWEKVCARWQVGSGVWYPRAGDPPRPGTLPLRVGYAGSSPVMAGLRHALTRLAVTRLWQFVSSGIEPEYEMDLELLDLTAYPGQDLYITFGEMDWLLYRSHEELAILAGAALVDAFKRAAPDWEHWIWHGFEETAA